MKNFWDLEAKDSYGFIASNGYIDFPKGFNHLKSNFPDLIILRTLKNVRFRSSSRKAKIFTGIHGIFRGLKFEPDTEIGQKGAFCKGLNLFSEPTSKVLSFMKSVQVTYLIMGVKNNPNISLD